MYVVFESGENTRQHNRRDGGVTLIELLVAIGLLALLAGLLVLLFRDGLRIWSQGEETRKEYTNAQFLFSRLDVDANQIWAPIDRRKVRDPNDAKLRPALYSSITPEGRRWIEFLRIKSGFQQQGEGGMSVDDRMKRTVYLNDPERGLLRGTFPASEIPQHLDEPGLLDSAEYRSGNFELVAKGILYADFKFWGPWTKEWTVKGPYGARDGAAVFWDSSRRRMDKFRMFVSDEDADPVPVLPKMIRVRVEVAISGKTNWPRLRGDLEEEKQTDGVRISNGEQLPESGYARVGSEWIYYEDRTDNRLKKIIRGRRSTVPKEHAGGTEVRYGAPFENTLEVPLYPGDSYYRRAVEGGN